MGENSPTVSVIIPSYNRAHLLGRSIASVLNQTDQDFEIIVIDDASTDNTEALISSLGNGRIRYIRHEKNKGAAASRNTGIKAAKGNYIAFQDSDDEWLPQKLEKQMKVFETAPINVGVVYTGLNRISGNDTTYVPYSWVTKKNGYIHQELLAGNFVDTPTILLRAECFKKVGLFDENLPSLEDWELVIRLSKQYSFICIDEPLLVSHSTPHSISDDHDAFVKGTKLIIEKHLEYFKKNKQLLANYYFMIGFNINRSDDFQHRKDYFIKAFKVFPYNRRLLLHTFLSLFGKRIYNVVFQYYRQLRSH